MDTLSPTHRLSPALTSHIAKLSVCSAKSNPRITFSGSPACTLSLATPTIVGLPKSSSACNRILPVASTPRGCDQGIYSYPLYHAVLDLGSTKKKN